MSFKSYFCPIIVLVHYLCILNPFTLLIELTNLS